jgi:phosphate transport system substrate-binding protein
MKNKYIVLIIAILLIIAVSGFSFLGNASAEKIEIVGSTSVQPVAEKLVENYQSSHKDVKINVQGGGSSVGIKSVKDGSADIGTSSKELKDDEKQGLTEYVIGNDGIVIAVNNQNKIADLSKDQLRDIFSGKITNWKEVGGADSSINLITREDGSGTLDAFESIVMKGSNGDNKENTKIKNDAIVQSSTEAVKQSIKQDPNAIGFVSFAHMSDDVKSLGIGGIDPTEATIADGTYELQRPFIFLVKGTPTGELKTFIDWIMGEEGSKIIADEKIVKSTK